MTTASRHIVHSPPLSLRRLLLGLTRHRTSTAARHEGPRATPARPAPVVWHAFDDDEWVPDSASRHRPTPGSRR
jgi:hypothetical protein